MPLRPTGGVIQGKGKLDRILRFPRLYSGTAARQTRLGEKTTLLRATYIQDIKHKNHILTTTLLSVTYANQISWHSHSTVYRLRLEDIISEQISHQEVHSDTTGRANTSRQFCLIYAPADFAAARVILTSEIVLNFNKTPTTDTINQDIIKL